MAWEGGGFYWINGISRPGSGPGLGTDCRSMDGKEQIEFGQWERFKKTSLWALVNASMLEYSMMDCMFSRYIYPANGS